MSVKQYKTAWSTFGRQRPEAPYSFFLTLANETLTQIAEYTVEDPVTFTCLMRSCRRMSGVCEYVRYTGLSVQGSKGRRLLATLISGTPTAARYCQIVKRAWFKYWHDAEMYIVSALMCEALALMSNLITLRIDAHTVDVAHTLDRMHRVGLIRTEQHPAYSMENMAKQAVVFTPLTLPSVQNMMISGNYALSSVANHRSLSELNLESFLDYDDLADFIFATENTLLGRSLTVLSLKLVRSISLAVAFPIISAAFPSLQRFSLEQASVKFMTAINTVAVSPVLFPQLRMLVLNRKVTYPLLRWGSRCEESESSFESISMKIGNTSYIHPILQYVGVGRHLWVRSDEGSFLAVEDLNPTKWWERYFGQQFTPQLYPQW